MNDKQIEKLARGVLEGMDGARHDDHNFSILLEYSEQEMIAMFAAGYRACYDAGCERCDERDAADWRKDAEDDYKREKNAEARSVNAANRRRNNS